ncbi:replication initiation factor domain-containing protein [Lactiplantibacillus plantarum]|uniref:replication initiation factor domain-containing protein n=1 Tax=Lactiplantibacillus plantarum TaxID=1590 RepID=UPI0015D47806|nr:replication initiation factor domain-containing protein [Lactiplantibacillus plantarum]
MTKMTISIDFVSISLMETQFPMLVSYLFPSLQQNDWVECQSGIKGFDKQYTNDKVRFHFSDESPTQLLILSGSACRYLETGNWSWQLFFKKVLDCKTAGIAAYFRIKRLDIAVDESGSSIQLKPHTIDRYLKQGVFTSRATRILFLNEKKIASRCSTGISCYIGQRSSKAYIFIYDKGLEQGMEADRWYRNEIRLRDPFALKMVDSIVRDPRLFGVLVAEYVRKRLQFRSPTSSIKEVRRRPLVGWYGRYLDRIAACELSYRY